jgi:aminopeptidase
MTQAKQTTTDLLALAYPDAFREGARNAVTTCLRISPQEKVTLIADESTVEIAAALATELAQLGCTWNAFVLEEIAQRPLKGMPQPVLDDMETSQVSIFAVQVQPNELRSRMDMTDVVNRRHMRHAHMVNITPDVMLQGMRADFNAVDRLSQVVLDKVRAATYVRATTPAGTDIYVQLNPAYKWFKTSSSRRKSGATCPAANASRLPARSTAPLSSMASWATSSARAMASCRARRSR